MNYRETANNTSWQRCGTVHIYNPLEGTKTCRFDEETVVQVGSRVVCAPESYITKDFDPEAVIPLLDPATGAPTGQTTTHGQLYLILYSLYIQTALERDAVPQEAP